MVMIPNFLIDNPHLDMYERAILPLLIRHTLSWGEKKVGVEALFLSQCLHLDVVSTINILDSLVGKGILELVHVQRARKKVLLYSLSQTVFANSDENSIPDSIEKSVALVEVNNSSYFLHISDEQYKNLKEFASKLIHSLKLDDDVFVDFELYQRSKNTKSYDWGAEFQRWALRQQKKENSKQVVKHELSFKPTPEQFQITQYFIGFLQKIDPQFIEPTDWSWAQEIKTLMEIENYSSEDIKKVIEWLFSSKGDWYRPNVQDAFALRKKFSYLISHVRSYRDSKAQVPADVDIFDLYEK